MSKPEEKLTNSDDDYLLIRGLMFNHVKVVVVAESKFNQLLEKEENFNYIVNFKEKGDS